MVSSNYFETLGLTLAAGRPFTRGEERPGAGTRVAIASYTLWRRRNFDPGFVGSPVRINGAYFPIVGVTPRGFAGAFAFVSPQWWLPLGSYETITNAMFKQRDTGLAGRDNHGAEPRRRAESGRGDRGGDAGARRIREGARLRFART